MATERTQHPTIRRVFLREEFLCPPSIFAKLFLRFENLNILSRSFDKVDKIDMFPEDSLEATRTLSDREMVYATRNSLNGIL
jgi:hypothetical protein